MHGATKALQRLPAENDYGNVEYKLRLKEPLPANRFHQLVTQMKYRLSEGAGECFYYVGAPLRLQAPSDACAQGSPAGHTILKHRLGKGAGERFTFTGFASGPDLCDTDRAERKCPLDSRPGSTLLRPYCRKPDTWALAHLPSFPCYSACGLLTPSS